MGIIKTVIVTLLIHVDMNELSIRSFRYSCYMHANSTLHTYLGLIYILLRFSSLGAKVKVDVLGYRPY